MAQQSPDLLCIEKHKNIDKKFTEQDERLNTHGNEIDELKNNQIRTEVIVEKLCGQIGGLVDEMAAERTDRHKQQSHLLWTIIGGFGTVILVFLGFILWYIQQL